MTTVIQTPSSDSSGVVVAFMIVLLVAVGFGIAYYNGVFTGSGKTTVIEHKTVNITVPAATPKP